LFLSLLQRVFAGTLFLFAGTKKNRCIAKATTIKQLPFVDKVIWKTSHGSVYSSVFYSAIHLATKHI